MYVFSFLGHTLPIYLFFTSEGIAHLIKGILTIKILAFWSCTFPPNPNTLHQM